MPPGRNDTCFCGSGKRYKYCHGAIGPAQSPVTPPDAATLHRRELMARALTFHQQGALHEALALYEEVLSSDPANFDALHMSGVIAYQSGDFNQAERLITKSLEVQPANASAVANLDLVRRGRSAAELERRWCKRILPLLADSCRGSGQVRAWEGQDVHLYLPDERPVPAALTALVRGLAPRVKLWSKHPEPDREITAIDYVQGSFPRSGTLIIARPCCEIGDWFERFPSERVLLFIETEDARAAVDGIVAASRDGQDPIELVYPSDFVAQAIGLPGRVASELVDLSPTGMSH